MITKPGIIFLVTLGLSSYGSPFTALPRDSDEFTNHSLQNNNAAAKINEDTKTTVNCITTPYNYQGRCPDSALSEGGQIIGSSCYFVGSWAEDFINAQIACGWVDGYLAQPRPNKEASQSLYSALKVAFPFAFRSLENKNITQVPGQLWLGYRQEFKDAENGDFIGQRNGSKSIQRNDPIIVEDVETVGQEAIAIKSNGYWTVYPSTRKLHYICRIPLI